MSIDTKSVASKRNRAFISSAMTQPMLSREHEFELAYLWRDKGDEKALHELVSAYVRLVISMATKFKHYGLSPADLVQEGSIGLMQAAARFQPEREIRFSTYASWWIKSSMQDYILRNWSIVRSGTSASQKSLFFNLRWLRSKIENLPGESLEEDVLVTVAERLKIKLKDVEAMSQRLSGRDQPLNAPIGLEGDETLENFLPYEGPSPEDLAIKGRDGEIRGRWLRKALNCLTDREQLILRERCLKDDRTTLEALGRRLGITKERVRQIEHKAYEKLKAGVVRLSRDPSNNRLSLAT